MPPLDKAAAAEKVEELARAKWQVTIERPMGISFNSRRREETAAAAQLAALREFYELHPEGITERLYLYCSAVT